MTFQQKQDIMLLQSDMFYLIISVKLAMTPTEAKHHLEEMHENISKGKKNYDNYSNILLNCHFSYLHFLTIEEKFLKND